MGKVGKLHTVDDSRWTRDRDDLVKIANGFAQDWFIGSTKFVDELLHAYSL